MEQNAVETAEAVQPEADDSWRKEMQARLQEYRERRVKNGWDGPGEAAGSGVRVIPFRRPMPARSMEWAIAEAEPEPEPERLTRRAGVAVAEPPEALVAVEPEAAVAPRPVVPVAPPRAVVREVETELAEPAIRPRQPRAMEPPQVQHTEQTRIRIELDAHWEEQNEAHVELPVPVAPRSLRFSAALNDLFYVLGGSALFGATAWFEMRMPGLPPAQEFKHLVPALIGVPFALFAVYLLLSYTLSDGTPGMKQAGLEVRDFTGARAGRRALRRRGWASALSLAACGLGFFWAGCDADRLTLHDHISSTFLTVRRRERAKKPVVRRRRPAAAASER